MTTNIPHVVDTSELVAMETKCITFFRFSSLRVHSGLALELET